VRHNAAMSVITNYRRASPDAVAEVQRLLNDPIKAVEYADTLPGTHTDKAWAGLSVLLLDLDPPVDVINGGDPLPGQDMIRLLPAADVAAGTAFLDRTPWDALAAGYDRAFMESVGVYPEDLWEADWALSYLEDAYLRLVPFFRAAAATGDAVLIWRS
jgi:Domain of unknown function (DUF1877)